MKIGLFANFLPLLFLCGCSSWDQREEYVSIYQSGQLEYAENLVDYEIQTHLPGEKFTESKDAVLLLLDRATIRFAWGDMEGAIHDYNLAIEAMDYYSQQSSTELLGQVILQDDVEAYSGEDFEQVLARVYFALALLQNGDENNALALLRQAEELQQQKCENYRKSRLTQDFELVENPAAKYLMAALLEHRGDHSNAEILYSQTENLLGKKLSDLKLRKENKEPDAATVIIIAHNGNAPYKISSVADASMASGLALEMMLGSCQIPPAYSSLAGIPVPVLMQMIFSNRVPIGSRLCREEKDLIPFYNITAVSAMQLQQKMPILVARGVARFILRRGTVACFQEQNPGLGALADVGVLVANACTQADTRSWRTLPSSLDLIRYDIPPGEHTLHLKVHWGIVAPFIEEYPLKLEPCDLCVINVFNIHPRIVSVQIPHKNKINKEYSYETSETIDSDQPHDAINSLTD
jgi:uncharacterized protein